MQCLIEDEEAATKKLILLRLILSLIIVAIYPVILYRKLAYHYEKYQIAAALQSQQIESKPEWLGNEISREYAEAANMVTVDGDDVPFGCNNQQWQTILRIMEQGDRLYEFRSPEESWEDFAGVEGVALVRNKEIVADLAILLN
jgi:hypothetical protein